MHPDNLRRLTAPEYICNLIVQCYQWVDHTAATLKNDAFQLTVGPGKPLYLLDRWVETYFSALVSGRFGDDVQVIKTEDAIPSFELGNAARTCILIDILDGAHLYQRGLSNWCSGITVFDSWSGKIHGAYIALPATDTIYFATETDAQAFSIRIPELNRIDRRPELVVGNSRFQPDARGWNRVPIRKPDGPTLLDHATVCMYAQRCTHLAGLATLPESLMNWLVRLTEVDHELRSTGGGEMGFRFYNLGGNPMLARLCDGGVDVVLDFAGALPNDWVPGAYIAAKAGAFVGKVGGTRMSEDDFASCLLRLGTSRIPYIVASSEQLFRQTASLMR